MFAEEKVMGSMKNVTGPAKENGIYLYYIMYTLGWICTTAWSLSFYPQVFINWKRKSVVGLSFDFIAFNFVGFLVYSVYIISLLWIPSIKAQNDASHADNNDSVHLADAVFSLHALLLVVITLFQCIIYERGDQKVSESTRVILVVLAIVVVVSLIVPAATSGKSSWTWLRSVNALSYIKVVVTVLKYWPQVLLNYRRKSTQGWSVHNVILDFIGGWVSLIQMFIDATASGSGIWPSSYQNIVKYWLCVITLVFDSIFLMQHYALYARKYQNYQPIDQHLNGVLDIPDAINDSGEDARDINLNRRQREVYWGNDGVGPPGQERERRTELLINQHGFAPSGSRYPPPNYGTIASQTTQRGENNDGRLSNGVIATGVSEPSDMNNCIHGPGHPCHQASAASVQALNGSAHPPSSISHSTQNVEDSRRGRDPTTEVTEPSGANNCIHGPGHPCHQARAVGLQDLADDVPINSPSDNIDGSGESDNSSISQHEHNENNGMSFHTGSTNTSSQMRPTAAADNRESDIYHGRTREEFERLQREYQDLGIHIYVPTN